MTKLGFFPLSSKLAALSFLHYRSDESSFLCMQHGIVEKSFFYNSCDNIWMVFHQSFKN